MWRASISTGFRTGSPTSSTATTPIRRHQHTTIFLFPGGFASQLVRARQPADAGPPFAFEPLWLTCGFLLGGAKALAIEGGDDSEQRFILPDGYVDFVTLQPYGGFADWCAANWLDVFVFGWDWRRPAPRRPISS